jgi:AraC family transcriptional activator of pobA
MPDLSRNADDFGRDGSDTLWYYPDMMQNEDSIPEYALYGDNQVFSAEDFFHCETIAARSERYNWEISEHLHTALGQILFVARGDVEVRFGPARLALSGPMLVLVSPGAAHGFRFSPRVLGFIVTVSVDFLESLGRTDVLRRRMRESTFHKPSPEDARALLQVGRQLLAAEQDRFDPDGHRLHRSLAEAWMRLATRPHVRAALTPAPIPQRFLSLVETNYRAHKPLRWYAEQLGCTVRTLSRQTEEAFSMSPLRVISRRLSLEARRMLRSSNASCGNIAAELGFEDPSYFSRFYLQNTGRRPSEEKRI